MAAYGLRVAPGLTAGDSGELIVAASQLSVAHPPGFPLYVLLGKLASLVPVGGLALRLNLLSALCGALAAGLLARALLAWGADRMSAVLGAAFFASAPLVWTWSTRAEVFALNNLLCAALLWCAAACNRPGARSAFWGLGAVTGLGLANHPTFILLAAPLAVALTVSPRARRPLLEAALIASGVAALLYLQLPLGAHFAPTDAWGEPTTAQGLLHHLLRADYGPLRLASVGATHGFELGASLRAFFADAGAQLALVGVLPAAVGLASVARRRDSLRPLGLALCACWLLGAFAFHALARFPVEPPLLRVVLARFWMLPLLVACFGAGLGLTLLRTLPRARHLTAGLAVALLAARGVQLFTAPGPPAQPGGHLPEAYAQAVLAPLPPGALLLSRGDLAGNALRYVQRAERLRPDVIHLDQELLTYPWYVARREAEHPALRLPGGRYAPGEPGGFSLAQLAAANPGRMLFTVGGVKPGDVSLSAAFTPVPFGLTERWVSSGAPAQTLALIRGQRTQLEALEPFARGLARPALSDPWEEALREEYWEARHRVGLGLLTWALAHGQPQDVLAESAAELEALLAAHPSPPAAYFKNAGIAYSRLGDELRMRAAFRGFLERAAPGDPDAATVAAALGPSR